MGKADDTSEAKGASLVVQGTKQGTFVPVPDAESYSEFLQRPEVRALDAKEDELHGITPLPKRMKAHFEADLFVYITSGMSLDEEQAAVGLRVLAVEQLVNVFRGGQLRLHIKGDAVKITEAPV